MFIFGSQCYPVQRAKHMVRTECFLLGCFDSLCQLQLNILQNFPTCSKNKNNLEITSKSVQRENSTNVSGEEIG